MDQLYTYEILQQLKKDSFSDDWGLLITILVQGLVLYFTIRWSVKLSREEFERQKVVDSASKKELDGQVKDVILISIEREVDNLAVIIKHLDDLRDLNIDNYSKKRVVTSDASFVEPILAIDLLNIDRVLKPLSIYNENINVVQLLTGLSALTVNYSKLNDVQSEFLKEYNNLTTELTLASFKRTGIIYSKETGLLTDTQKKIEEAHTDFITKIKEQVYNPSFELGMKSEISHHIDLGRTLNRIIDFDRNPEFINSPIYLANLEVDSKSSQIKYCIANFVSEIETINEQFNISINILNCYMHALKSH